MQPNYFEEQHQEEIRRAEWKMLNLALRKRRQYTTPRSIIATLLWILGVR